MSYPEKSLHKKVFQKRKMSIKNEMPNKSKVGRIATHSDSFKVQLALEYLDGDYSCAQVARKYNLGVKTVEYFVLWYRKNPQLVMADKPLETEEAFLSAQEHKDLKKKLALAEMKVAALEKVIAIANATYGTDLKKKAATK